MKIIVPRTEYPKFINCDVYEKDPLGNARFLYRISEPKELLNMERFRKLLRFDNALRYLENQLDLLTVVKADKDIVEIVQTAIDKLTNDEVI